LQEIGRRSEIIQHSKVRYGEVPAYR
jgi:hypothetical protein